MKTTIKTEAIMDNRGIEGTTELDLPSSDLAAIGPEFERELRGLQIEIMAAMAAERQKGDEVHENH